MADNPSSVSVDTAALGPAAARYESVSKSVPHPVEHLPHAGLELVRHRLWRRLKPDDR